MNLFRDGSFYVYGILKSNVVLTISRCVLKKKAYKQETKDLVMVCKPFDYIMCKY